MPDRTCSADGCDRPVYCRELCARDYRRWLRYDGSTDLPERPAKGCSAQDCPSPHFGNGLCNKHYLRTRKTGSLEGPVQRDPVCTVDDCERPHLARGFCKRHWSQDDYRRNGDAIRAARKDWERRNPGKAAEYARRGYARHRDRARAYRRRYYAENRDAILASSRQYRQQNAEAIAERKRIYAQANADRLGEYYAEWARLNPGKRRESHRRRRARLAGTFVRQVDYAAILAGFGMVCHICGGGIGSATDLHFDHVIPVSRGGSHVQENILPSHTICNLRKGTKLMSELLPAGGR